MAWYKEAETERIASEYKKALYRGIGFYPFRDENGIFQAKIHSVYADGLLELETLAGERRRYYFKEVEFVH
jgi:BirA family biotin operon repressor/biotin-[acetyl-CoA-carboxylase] ligase